MSIPAWLEDHCARLSADDSDLGNLNLNIRRLNAVMTASLMDALRFNTNLLVLNLTSSLIHDSSAIIPIAAALSRNTTLRTLHLSYNSLADVAILGPAIARNRSLQELHLDYNSIDMESLMALAEGISSNATLKVLNLSNAKVGDEGCAALASALTRNNRLTTILLKNNLITDKGGKALESAVAINFSLERVDTSENVISHELQSNLQLFCRANKAGRKHVFREDFPLSLWPKLLEHMTSDTELLLHFLRSKPDVCCSSRQSQKRRRID